MAASSSKQSNAASAPSCNKSSAVEQPGKGTCFDERIARSSLGTLSADDVQAGASGQLHSCPSSVGVEYGSTDERVVVFCCSAARPNRASDVDLKETQTKLQWTHRRKRLL